MTKSTRPCGSHTHLLFLRLPRMLFSIYIGFPLSRASFCVRPQTINQEWNSGLGTWKGTLLLTRTTLDVHFCTILMSPLTSPSPQQLCSPCLQQRTRKVPSLRMVPILIWHSGFSMVSKVSSLSLGCHPCGSRSILNPSQLNSIPWLLRPQPSAYLHLVQEELLDLMHFQRYGRMQIKNQSHLESRLPPREVNQTPMPSSNRCCQNCSGKDSLCQNPSAPAPTGEGACHRHVRHGSKHTSRHMERAHREILAFVVRCCTCCCAIHRHAQEIGADAEDSHGIHHCSFNPRAGCRLSGREASTKGHGRGEGNDFRG